jgi:uncharacterized protein
MAPTNKSCDGCGCSFWPHWKENRLFALLVSILVVYALVFLTVVIRNETIKTGTIGKAPAERQTISFDGTGKVVGTPDIATVDMGMTTQDANVQNALKTNNEKMNALVATLKAVGVAAADIQTSRFNVYPNYDYSNSKQTIISYTADQSVTVKIRNLNAISQVLDAAGESGANNVSGLDFTIDNPEALQVSAREKAIADAMTKAETLSKELGIKFTKIVNFTESGANPSPMPYLDYSKESAGGGTPSVAPTIESGSFDITSNVTLTFEIE